MVSWFVIGDLGSVQNDFLLLYHDSMINQHQTIIWENMFVTFSKHRTSRSMVNIGGDWSLAVFIFRHIQTLGGPSQETPPMPPTQEIRSY